MLVLEPITRRKRGLTAMSALAQNDFNSATLEAAEIIITYLKRIDYNPTYKEVSGRERISRNVAAMYAIETFEQVADTVDWKALYQRHWTADADGKHRGSVTITYSHVDMIQRIGKIIDQRRGSYNMPRFKDKDGYNQRLIIGLALIYTADVLRGQG